MFLFGCSASMCVLNIKWAKGSGCSLIYGIQMLTVTGLKDLSVFCTVWISWEFQIKACVQGGWLLFILPWLRWEGILIFYVAPAFLHVPLIHSLGQVTIHWSALMIKIHHLCELRVSKAMEFWRFFHLSHSSYLFLFAECVWSLKVYWTEICSNYWRTSSWACLVLCCLLLSVYVLSVSQLHLMVFSLGVETCSWMSFCSWVW
jgi:hypothetical protein